MSTNYTQVELNDLRSKLSEVTQRSFDIVLNADKEYNYIMKEGQRGFDHYDERIHMLPEYAQRALYVVHQTTDDNLVMLHQTNPKQYEVAVAEEQGFIRGVLFIMNIIDEMKKDLLLVMDTNKPKEDGV
jgi:hypothetical protein